MKIKREVRIGCIPNEWLISLLLVSGRIAKRFIRKKYRHPVIRKLC